MANLSPKVTVPAGAGLAAALALSVPFIAQREGYNSHPYKDVVGVLTVCEGHTGPDIVLHKVYTKAECTSILETDVTKFADGVVNISPELKNKTYVLAATISFSYNIGIKNYQKSSIARDFHLGHYSAGCKNMLKYTFARGRFIPGLANRRGAEYTICMKGV